MDRGACGHSPQGRRVWHNWVIIHKYSRKYKLHSCSPIHALSLLLCFFLFIDKFIGISQLQHNKMHTTGKYWSENIRRQFFFFFIYALSQIVNRLQEASADLRLYTQARWQSPAATQKVLLARDDRWIHMEPMLLFKESQEHFSISFLVFVKDQCVFLVRSVAEDFNFYHVLSAIFFNFWDVHLWCRNMYCHVNINTEIMNQQYVSS